MYRAADEKFYELYMHFSSVSVQYPQTRPPWGSRREGRSSDPGHPGGGEGKEGDRTWPPWGWSGEAQTQSLRGEEGRGSDVPPWGWRARDQTRLPHGVGGGRGSDVPPMGLEEGGERLRCATHGVRGGRGGDQTCPPWGWRREGIRPGYPMGLEEGGERIRRAPHGVGGGRGGDQTQSPHGVGGGAQAPPGPAGGSIPCPSRPTPGLAVGEARPPPRVSKPGRRRRLRLPRVSGPWAPPAPGERGGCPGAGRGRGWRGE
ncbi:unnamed protein product [Eretmochelys imbricata]